MYSLPARWPNICHTPGNHAHARERLYRINGYLIVLTLKTK
jgi:hypothetical protein